MKIDAYTKDDTLRLKGFGILLICLHNYFHFLWPSPGENEFKFSSERIFNLFSQLGYDGGEFFNLLLSYFGHFGVQVFILVSGYGLAASMMMRGQSWGVFVVNRWKKLYPLLLTALSFYILFGRMLLDGAPPYSYHWREMGYKLLLIHTLLPDSGLSLCGPWWFFGLIFQLYLLFPLLFWLFKRYDWKAFLGTSLVAYGMIFFFREAMPAFSGSILMQNAPGHLPEFCFGIWLCLNKEKNLSWIWLVVAVVLFGLGNFFAGFYPFTFLSVAVITVFVFHAVKRRHPSSVVSRFFVWLGGVSMALFATHGFLRDPFLSVAGKWGGAWGHFFSGVVFFTTACLLALAAKHLYDLLLWLFDKIPVVENRAAKVVSRCAMVFLCLFVVYVFTYYIAMNVRERETRQMAVGDTVKVEKTENTISLVDFTFPNNSQWVCVEGSFDIVSNDTQAVLPLVVIDISGDIFWKSLEIPAKFNDGQQHHYEFVFDFKRPFMRKIKNKPMKVFLWNNSNASVSVEQLDVTLKY